MHELFEGPRLESPRRIRFALALIGGALLAIIALACLPPSQRAQLPLDGPAYKGAHHSLAAAITKVRPAGEEWAIAIDPADINAWLATRLPKWIEHDPTLADLTPITALRIASTTDALQVEQPYGPFIASLAFTPSIEDERIAVSIATPRIGRLPIPGLASELTIALQSHLAASSPHAIARFRLADDRRIEVREISCKPGRIALLFATLPSVD